MTGPRPARGLIVAGAFSLLVPAFIALTSAACTALWAQAGTWGFFGVMTACGVSLIWTGMNGRPLARMLALLPAGLVTGLQFQPSTGALVALLVTGLALGAAPRNRFAEALALFAGAVAFGNLVLTGAFSGGASC